MSAGEVLFQGTWEEAVRHAEEIPSGTQVQVVEVAPVKQVLSGEQLQATFEELISEARRLDAEAKAQGIVATPTDDPYTQILLEKVRKQGLRLE